MAQNLKSMWQQRNGRSQCVVTVWVAVCVAACAQCSLAQNAAFAPGFLPMLPMLRPAKTVLRSVRAAAPSLFLTMEERVRQWGYPFETHRVRTEDGYLLGVHRIPRGRRNSNDTNNANQRDDSVRPAVILQHGMLSSSEYWIVAGPEVSPALQLADQGYDVWMTNTRGNHMSNKHERMKRSDPRFWKFSWHEMGVYDTPAAIDYILNSTKQDKLFFISHSMGNTLFYVAMAMRPEYNEKIRLQVALSPAVYFDGTSSGAVQLINANANYIKALLDALPTYELPLKSDAGTALIYLTCGEKAPFNKLCAVMFSWIVGPVDLNNTTRLCRILSGSGSSSSGLVLWHYYHVVRAHDFVQYDHGAEENKRRYGSPKPPKYPLEKVTAPVALYASDSDVLVNSKGVRRLAKVLPNVVSLLVVNETFFNHMDFGVHPKLNELIMNHVLETMKQF